MSPIEGPLQVALVEDASLLVLTLARPPANVIDRDLIAALRAALREHAAMPGLRAVLLQGAGPHFSYGASIEQHRAREVAELLAAFHALFRELAGCGRVLLAAVRGCCLGGGLELAAFCTRVFAAADARLGCPEIRLGVFAPVASVVLPRRCGQPVADDLLLTGRKVGAAEAQAVRLVDEVVEDPYAAALDWHREHLLPASASSLMHAVHAARAALHGELDTLLPALERRYLEGLMNTVDAAEGIEAFLAKRAPRWRHA